jgi:hypothetical protein
MTPTQVNLFEQELELMHLYDFQTLHCEVLLCVKRIAYCICKLVHHCYV